METNFNDLLKKWTKNALRVEAEHPVYLLSKQDLSDAELESFRGDFIEACGEKTLSVVLSLKMMHIYFRLGPQLFDYRPHRGPFSKVTQSPYRIGKTDRAEVLLEFKSEELARFRTYIEHIEQSPRSVLGSAHPLQIREPDFTVRSHETTGLLNGNHLINSSERHNCMTWFSTAPLGPDGSPVWSLLGMSQSDLLSEAHSYIVRFYQYLVESAPKERIASMVLWTNESISSAVEKIRSKPNFLADFYSVSAR